MGRKALALGEATEIRSTASVVEVAATDRYGRPAAKVVTTWTATARRRATESGEVERRSAKGATKAQAEERLRAALKHDAKRPAQPGSSVVDATVAGFARAWFEGQVFEAKLEPTSLASYATTIRLHIVPQLGEFRVEQLKAARIRQWLTDLHTGTATKAGSPATAKKAKAILNGLLALAEEDGALLRNPLPGMSLKLPKKPRTEATIVPADRVQELLARADQHTYNNGRLGQYLRVQLGTGARIGEVLALRRGEYWPATETHPARVLIDGTIIAPETGAVYRKPEPKRSTARRNIPITSYAAAAIEQRLAILDRQGRTGPNELVFQTSKGTPVAPANLRRAWRAVRVDLPGLEKLKLHALRATMASALVYSVGPDKAARQLGHTGTGTIFAHYLHRRAFVDEVSLDAMETYAEPPALEA